MDYELDLPSWNLLCLKSGCRTRDRKHSPSAPWAQTQFSLILPPGGAIGQGWDASLPSSTGETWRVSCGREDRGRRHLSLRNILDVCMSWSVIN